MRAGRCGFSFANGSSVKGVPFATILRVADGAIVERRDYGDYRELASASPVEPHLEDVAREYLAAYLERRFADLAELAGASLRFQDPTAVLIGGGRVVEGPEAVRAHLERAFQGSLSFELEPTLSFFYHRTALFAGTCRYAYAGRTLGLPVEKASFEVPLVVVLQVRDGEVVEHRDYAGYEDFQAQMASYRKAARKSPRGH